MEHKPSQSGVGGQRVMAQPTQSIQDDAHAWVAEIPHVQRMPQLVNQSCARPVELPAAFASAKRLGVLPSSGALRSPGGDRMRCNPSAQCTCTARRVTGTDAGK
jgi:hypothetical protein